MKIFTHDFAMLFIIMQPQTQASHVQTMGLCFFSHQCIHHEGGFFSVMSPNVFIKEYVGGELLRQMRAKCEVY